ANVTRESGVVHANPRSVAFTRKFKADQGCGAGLVAAVPGMDEQTGRIDLDVLALNMEGLAVGADAVGAPLAAGPNIGLHPGHAVHALFSPPLHELARINESLEHALGRGGDEDIDL